VFTYTAMHGVGYKFIVQAFKVFGFKSNFVPVKEQVCEGVALVCHAIGQGLDTGFVIHLHPCISLLFPTPFSVLVNLPSRFHLSRGLLHLSLLTTSANFLSHPSIICSTSPAHLMPLLTYATPHLCHSSIVPLIISLLNLSFEPVSSLNARVLHFCSSPHTKVIRLFPVVYVW